MGVVKQSVHRGRAEKGVAEEVGEFWRGAVRCDDRGATLVPGADQLVEVGGFVAAQRNETEIIEDEQSRSGEFCDALFVGVVGPCGAELLEHLGRVDVQYSMPRAARAVTESLREMGLADAGRSRHILLTFLVLRRSITRGIRFLGRH